MCFKYFKDCGGFTWYKTAYYVDDSFQIEIWMRWTHEKINIHIECCCIFLLKINTLNPKWKMINVSHRIKWNENWNTHINNIYVFHTAKSLIKNLLALAFWIIFLFLFHIKNVVWNELLLKLVTFYDLEQLNCENCAWDLRILR